MDAIAEDSICGISDPIGVGIVPGSDTAHLALFGYDPYKYYHGRGVFEALGAGIKLYEGDVAIRCNFATAEAGTSITDRRAGRIESADAEALAAAIKQIKIRDIDFFFNHTVGHRGVLVIRGAAISPRISDTDPHQPTGAVAPLMKSRPLDATEAARRTADALNDWTRKVNEILKVHPVNKKRKQAKKQQANIILCRGASPPPVGIPKFEEKYGLSAACVAGGMLYKGVAKYVGMDVIPVKGATATPDTNLQAKVSATLDALKKYDFVFLHIKGCDMVSHDGDAAAKVKFIERIDKALKPLLGLKDTLIILTSDHTTAVSLKAHSADPVSIAIMGDGVRVDRVSKFDEVSCAEGGLQKINHLDILPIVLGLLGKAPMFGT
jgi:2,3-bisphosphoglycerate-independent phosphoglycerate mutase